LIAFSVLLALVWWAKESLGLDLDPEQLRAVDAAWSPRWIGAFLVFWILGNSVLWPTLAGGVLFGWGGGVLMNLLGASIAAVVQLLVIRVFLRAPAEAWFGQRLRVLAAAVEHRGAALLVIWRLLWLPVSWITVAAALTRIPVWQHVAAVLAMVPGLVAITGMADAMVVEGPTGVPLWRWGLLVGVFAVSLAAWGWAQRHYPALSVLRRGGDDAVDPGTDAA
jgi:uncharacterized membrane protein YdjX (TVP38/TMEM64 family)